MKKCIATYEDNNSYDYYLLESSEQKLDIDSIVSKFGNYKTISCINENISDKRITATEGFWLVQTKKETMEYIRIISCDNDSDFEVIS